MAEHDVDFVLVGGLASVVYGVSMFTEDIDVAAPLTRENIPKILAALGDLHPRHRMTPTRKPLDETPDQLMRFENLYLVTDLGQVDFLGQIAGIGDYQAVLQSSVTTQYKGRRLRILSLESLIRSKEALDRPKDREALIHLRAVLEQLRTRSPGR